jgi:hypothetical protein
MADFAMTWHLIHWRVLAIRAIVGAIIGISRLSPCDMPTDMKPGHCKIRQNLQAVAYWAKPLGMSRCDSNDMPMVAPTLVRTTAPWAHLNHHCVTLSL